MRHLYSGIFLILLMFSLRPAMGQVVDILIEDFDGAPPAGWVSNSITYTSYARFTSVNSTITTPVIDLSGYINVSLEFEVAKYGTGTDGPLTVEVSDDGGSTWTAQTFDSPTPISSSYLTSGPTAIAATGANVKIRFIRTSSPGSEKRLTDFVLKGEESITLCTTPSQLAFTDFPSAISQSSNFPIQVSVLCADDGISDCNNGSVTLSSDACGLSGTLTQPVVDGIATFDDLEISRSLQPGIHFTAEYSGTCGSYTIQSPNVDVEAPAATAGGLKIAFIKINSSDPDEFAFVALSEIPNGQQIFFSDNGWYDTGGFRDNEGTLLWTATSDISCGTIVTVTGTNSASTGTVTHPNTAFALATSGDQILAFTGSEAAPTFIAGISIDGSCWGDATSSNTSALPAPLVEGINAVCLGETDNSILTFSPSGDPDEVMAQINTPANWTNSGSRINSAYSGTITVNCATGDPTPLPTADAGADFIGCNGGPNALAVTVTDAIGSVSYSWSSSGPINGETDGQTAEATNTSTATYTVTVTDDDGCESTAEVTVNIPSGPAGQWTDSYGNSDWFECLNWANGKVPDTSTDVTIPSSTSDPEIADEPFNAFCKDLNIEPGRTLLLEGDPDLTLEVHGDITGSGTLYVEVGDLIFAGSANQTIDADLAILTYNLKINKPAETLITSNTSIDVTNNAEFISGILEMANGNSLILYLDATATGASNISFVDGVVEKTSNGTEFTFPIGDSNAEGYFYQPARMFGFSGMTNVEAQYFAEAEPNAGQHYDGETNNPNDNHEIGNCDYWNITRVSGDDVRLGFAFTNIDAEYCNQLQPGGESYLYLSRWNGLSWDYPIDEGSDPVGVPGEISSTIPIALYGHFVLASPSFTLVALPIELIEFNARKKDTQVQTDWITATETNNAFFTVERSADARTFTSIGTLPGAGTSHSRLHYTYTDIAPFSGISYYRLKQTDFDGAVTYSDIRSVEMPVSGNFGIEKVYRSEENLELVYTSEAENNLVEIFDLLGKRLFVENIENNNGRSRILPRLQRGAYIIRISAGGKSDTEKFAW